MIPILTNVAVALPGIFVGSFLIEVFFSIPGLGREILLAVNRSDYPVIQAFAIYLAVITMVVNLLHRRALQAGRSAGGAAMSAVLEAPIAAAAARRARSAGVWTGGGAALSQRPRRHGLARDRARCSCCSIVASARRPGRQRLAGRARRARRAADLPRPGAPRPRAIAVAAPSGPNVDISAVDPLAPRYKEWDEAAKKYQTTERVKAETLPVRRRPARPRRPRQGDQGRAGLDPRRRLGGAARDADRHAARRARAASSAARSATCSSGSTTSSPRSRASC